MKPIKNEALENTIDSISSQNRNEKKCRKALIKNGNMKTYLGINRITLKKKDGVIFYIDNPEVLYSQNRYAIFCEM